MPISLRHMAVIDEYLINGNNASQAMQTVGYTAKHANHASRQIFHREDVKAELAKRRARVAKKYEVTVDKVVEGLLRIAESGLSLAKFKKVQKDGTLMWDFSGATEDDIALISELGVDYYMDGRGPEAVKVNKFRVKQPDQMAAWVALGRHLGMFQDIVKVSGDSIADQIRAGRKRSSPPEPDVETVH